MNSMPMPGPAGHAHVSAASFEALRERFVQSLGSRAAELEDLIADIAERGPERDLMNRLFYVAHNISGVAPTYGFKRLALLSAALEKVLLRCREIHEGRVPTEHVLLPADLLADELHEIAGDEVFM